MPEKKLTAQRILTTCNKMREDLWPLWCRERALVSFYNSGPLPADYNEECADEAPISLGVGYRYIKKPLESLLDVILNRPGFLKSELCYPLRAERKGMVESAADQEMNAIAHKRMESTIRSLCGRAIITGRGFLFRLSRWDWKFRSGRLLSALDDTDDVHDESFREWAFVGQMTLRHLDELLESTRNRDGIGGWSNTSLQALKEYIVSTTVAEKDAPRETIVRMSATPFDDDMSRNPLDVYWYFRKNGEKNPDGGEKVDLYCVSRWSMKSAIAQGHGDDGTVYKSLQVAGDAEKEQLIYHLPNAFESVDECLIPMLLDARIDGEQQMNQVEGVGKIMTPRLQSMEHITVALLEGIAFGVQPNWTSASAGAVDQALLRQMQRNGLNPWDYVPPGLTVMNKSNSMQGLNQGMQFLQMLGMSSEADAQTGEMSPTGESQARFKAEAMQLLSQLGTGVQRRAEKSFYTLDSLAEQIAATLSRPFEKWRKADPAYYDVRRFQTNMLTLHRVHPAEFAPERMKCVCRRLAGNMEKSQAVQKATAFMQFWGGTIAPEGARIIGKEVARATWDDPTAELLFPVQTQTPQSQEEAADEQNFKALVTLQVPRRRPGDDPGAHLPIHAAALESHMRIVMEVGSITPQQREGLAALLVHTTEDVRGIPLQQQQQIGKMLQGYAMALQKLPLSGGQDDMAARQQALKEAQFGFAQQREQNLVADRNLKHELKQQEFLLKVRGFLQTQKKDGVEMAGKLLDMMEPETPALPESAPA